MAPRNSAIHNLIYGRQGTDGDEHWYSTAERTWVSVQQDLTESDIANITQASDQQDSTSADFAHKLRHASNSVMAVIGVVEPTSRPRPDELRLEPPSLETRELDDQRREADHHQFTGPRSGLLNYLRPLLLPLCTTWASGLAIRLLAFPARSRMSIVQQARSDISVVGPFQFLFAGAPAAMAIQVLFYSSVRTSLNYGFVRMILAQVSSSQDRTFLLSFQPYFDQLFLNFRLFAFFPLTAHFIAQSIGLLPYLPTLPNFFERRYWISSTFEMRAVRQLLLMMVLQRTAFYLAEVVKFLLLEFDSEYVGLGRRVYHLTFGSENEITAEEMSDDEPEDSQEEFPRQPAKNENTIPLLVEPMPLSLYYKPIASGLMGRIGLGMLQYTLLDLPLQVYFLGRTVGRFSVKGANVPGFLGLNGWRAFGGWLLQVEWFAALSGLFREFQIFILDT